ncbi:MAG TPA: hypothetical protein VFT37_06080 [Telluria sp.]|nr:hypothetical protein [Telluria sp.]
MEKAPGSGPHPGPGGRELRRGLIDGEAPLVLSELEYALVFDEGAQTEPVLSAGLVRETCPHCPGEHLKLVLRQESVRLAHLFCEKCRTCYDARYLNGRCALTI